MQISEHINNKQKYILLYYPVILNGKKNMRRIVHMTVKTDNNRCI